MYLNFFKIKTKFTQKKRTLWFEFTFWSKWLSYFKLFLTYWEIDKISISINILSINLFIGHSILKKYKINLIFKNKTGIYIKFITIIVICYLYIEFLTQSLVFMDYLVLFKILLSLFSSSQFINCSSNAKTLFLYLLYANS